MSIDLSSVARPTILALLVVCALSPAPAVAQETVNYASLGGKVTDPQDAVIVGAHVIARQIETNLAADTITDQQGRFRFPYLKVGPYEIRINQPGFAEAIQRLTLSVGAAFDLPVTLTVDAVATNVTVSAEATVLDTARTQIAGTVTQIEARNLPLNGRNFLDLALLVPGVSPTNVGTTQLFAETSAVPGQGLSIGSQRNLSNNFIVDGLSANDDAAGLAGIPYGVDAIDQFQVITSGGQAELGRALGGYISVVTKSGTNALHVDGYDYIRNSRFNSANALSGTKLPMSQNQYGFSIGGPVVRDRTFYFSNFERRRLEQSGLVTIAPESVRAINARLSAVGYPGALIATGPYENPVYSSNLLAKVDHSLSGSDQLSVRYSLYDVTSGNSRGAGALSAATASAGLDNLDQTIALANTTTLSLRTVNELRAQFAVSDLKAPPSDPIGPAVSIAGVASFGTLSGSPTRRVNRMFQVVDNVSHQRGAHALRAGVDILYNDDHITYPRSIRGSYSFSSLDAFLSGTYNNSGFTQTFGATSIVQTNPNVGVYAQDEWKVRPTVTFNAGLRYDLQFLQTIATDHGNMSPRIGIAWTPSASRRTVIRSSAGIYYDRVPLRALANALLSANNTTALGNLRQTSVSLSPAQAAAPIFPKILNAPVPAVTLFNLTTMDPHMQNARSRQLSAEVEQQIGDRSTIGIGYQYVRGLDLIMSVNQNVPTCLASGTNNGCRPIADYANNSQYSPVGSSNYHGLHVSFVQRPAAWGSYRVSYTLSKSMNDVGENFFSAPIDPTDISRDWGRSDDDQRHRLVINGSVNAPIAQAETVLRRILYGFQLSGMLQSYSALPFNITSGVTTIQGTAGRPIVEGAFIHRNAGVGGSFLSLNMRLSRSFPVAHAARAEAAVEAFNLTNRRNDLARNANFGPGTYPTNPSSTFGQVTTVGDPRTLQFAVRFRF